jgi:hypothetical protein
MKKVQEFIHLVIMLFALKGILLIPFSFKIFDFQAKITKFLFQDLVLFIASKNKNIVVVNPEFTSDATTLYLLIAILFIIAICVGILIKFSKTNHKKFNQYIKIIVVYYLAVILLKYGFDKIFKVQFYLPEPDILYTPLGLLDKDILFWSTIGTSYSYNVFLGILEVIPAVLLLFYRTRILGLLILFGVLIHVVFVNFAFDISVKLYASFLLFITFLLLIPFLKTLYQFLILNKASKLVSFSGKNLLSNQKRLIVKSVIIGLMTLEIFTPYLDNGVYNADNLKKNELHGAYQVLEIKDKKINPDKINIKRVFIHSQNYLIFQFNDDTFIDYKVEFYSKSNQMNLVNYENKTVKVNYNYSKKNKKLELNFKEDGVLIVLKSLTWKELPLLKQQFHWTIDGVK